MRSMIFQIIDLKKLRYKKETFLWHTDQAAEATEAAVTAIATAAVTAGATAAHIVLREAVHIHTEAVITIITTIIIIITAGDMYITITAARRDMFTVKISLKIWASDALLLSL